MDQRITQREMADCFGSTPQNVTLHLAAMRRSGLNIDEQTEARVCHEGSRRIARRVKTYPLQVAYAIALKVGNAAAAEAIQSRAALAGLVLKEALFLRPEFNFGELLQCLSDVRPAISQHRFGRRRVDYFFPSHNLAVEFDEPSHSHSRAPTEDRSRQADISSRYGVEFIRVRHGSELEGFRELVRRLFA